MTHSCLCYPRYYHAQGVPAESTQAAIIAFTQYGSSTGYTPYTFEELAEAPAPTSIQGQLTFLSCLPNNPWWSFPRTGRLKGLSCPDGKVKLLQQLSYQAPQLDEEAEELLAPEQLPLSFRNRVIYFSVTNNHRRLKELVDYCLGPEVHQYPDTAYEPTAVFHPRRKKFQLVRLDEEQLGELGFANNMATPLTCYQAFKSQLLSAEGTIAWRFHSSEQDIILLNSYSSKDGVWLPSTYSHLCVHHFDDGNVLMCDCEMYKILAAQATGEALDSSGITCMHARFYCDVIQPHQHELFRDLQLPVSNIMQKLMTSVSFSNLGKQDIFFY